MKLQKLKELSWGQKFALIDTYKLTDDVICEKMGLLPSELSVAKNLREKGTFKVDTSFDASRYHDVLFPPTKAVTKKASATTTVATGDTTGDGEPKRRGRKGDKISKAFAVVSANRVSVEAFIAEHGVSLAVLRQSKRFDKSGLGGVVCVRKHEGVLSIWREAEPTTVADAAPVEVVQAPPEVIAPPKAKATKPTGKTSKKVSAPAEPVPA